MTAYVSGAFEATPDSLGQWPKAVDAAANAVRQAAADAGLGPEEIGGILTYDSVVDPHLEQAAQIAERIGARPTFASTVGAAGATPVTAIAYAKALIQEEMAENVVVAHADLRVSRPPAGGMLSRMAQVASNAEFEAPYGTIAATFYALLAEPFLREQGLLPEHLDQVAKSQRAYGLMNPNARRAIPWDPDRDSRPVVGAFRRSDCCLVTDFASAVVISSQPGDKGAVAVVGTGSAVNNESFLGSAFDDLLAAPARAAAMAYGAAGCRPQDIDVALLYDSFTATVLWQLTAYGLDRGMGVRRFLDEVGLGPQGLPVNTHGGMLAASTSGLLHVVEAVRQLRGTAGERQVPGARRALVTNAGGIFSLHAAVVLERLAS